MFAATSMKAELHLRHSCPPYSNVDSESFLRQTALGLQARIFPPEVVAGWIDTDFVQFSE